MQSRSLVEDQSFSRFPKYFQVTNFSFFAFYKPHRFFFSNQSNNKLMRLFPFKPELGCQTAQMDHILKIRLGHIDLLGFPKTS